MWAVRGLSYTIGIFRLCGESAAHSFLVLRLAISGLHMIKYFSSRQRLHVLLEVEYGLLLAMIIHFNVKGVLLSFNVQIYWLRVVEFPLFYFISEAVSVANVSSLECVPC